MNEVVSSPRREITSQTPLESRRPLELPTPEQVPIIKEYGRLGIERFMDRYAVPTETDERGFVDYRWLLAYVHSLVPPSHTWVGKLDVHHLQWTGASYQPEHFEEHDDPTIPDQFREMPFHKLLIPRDLHDLIHIVTLPPPLPEYEQMERRVTAYNTAIKLFHAAKQAIEVATREERLIPAPHSKYRNRTYDPVARKLIERDVLIDRYWEFYTEFKGRLSEIAQHDVDDLIDLDRIRSRDPIFSVVSSLDKAVRLNKQKQAIKPKVRWNTKHKQKAA